MTTGETMDKNYTVIMGIDIGLRGAIAFWDVYGKELLSIYDMPTYEIETKSGRKKGKLDLPKLLHILEIPKIHNEDVLVVMEDINTFPGQGIVSMGTFLEEKGILHGMTHTLGYDIQFIQPKAWQKYFDLVPPKDLKGITSKKTRELRKKWLKENSRLKAMQEFPKEWSSKFEDNDAHGRSDACLIAKYSSLLI